MAKLVLVRHGQAAFGTDHYDRLSPLGRQQARWLGVHFAQAGLRCARVVAGTLERQRDTAVELVDAMGLAGLDIGSDEGLNEYRAEALYQSHTGSSDHKAHQQRDFRDYWRTFRAAMAAWADDRLIDVPETWAHFGARTRAAVQAALQGAARDDTVLVVSSGGVIGRLVADVVGAPAAAAIELNLQIRNTGVTEMIAGSGAWRLLSYNAIPHLESPERRGSITFA